MIVTKKKVVRKLIMKSFIVLLLLFTTLLIGIKPIYSQCFSALNNMEKQLEEVSTSETYTHKNEKFNAPTKKITLPIPRTFISYPTSVYDFGIKLNFTYLPEFCKYGIRVLHCSYLN